MDKKKILIGLGILAAAGIGFYFWNKSRKKNATGGLSGDEVINEPDLKSETESDDDTNESNDEPVSLNRKEKRRERRATCKEKYGKGKAYRQCKLRVRKGGVAFDGSDFEQFENDYIDFSGLNLDLN